MKKPIVNFLEPSQQQLNSLLEHYQTGRYADAEKLSLSITQEFPEHQFAWKVLAVVLKLTGRISESLVASQKSVQLGPLNAEAHNNLAVLLKELGRLKEAEVSYKKAIELKPDYAEAHSNLAIILKEQSRLKEAEACYRQAIKLKPDYAEAHYNMGNTLKELGRLEEAEASYKKAITLKPDYVKAYNNLGVMLQEQGRLDEAEVSYKKAITLKPDYADFYANLGNTLRDQDKLLEAKLNYKKAIELKGDSKKFKHIFDALTGKTTNFAPREYVEVLFDNYAINFENSLVNKLEYKTPNKIVEMIVAKNPNIQLGSVLDLGCGTGLIGDEIKKYCSNLEGVDLSKLMLEKASAKNIYDKLEHKDIVEYLSTEDLDFNYFISSDVFVYVGNLSEIFRLIKSRNKSKGKFVFSTEHTDRDGFFLEQTGRYSHSKKYIESLCNKFGYKLSHFEVVNLRKNKNKFIIGGLYFLDF
jgi:predicted TPR repeat methyltransferase